MFTAAVLFWAAGDSTGRAQAQADAPIRVEVLIVLASEAAGSIDPALAGEPALRRPPFNQFHSMRVLGRPTGAITATAPMMVDLPNGRRLQVALAERLADGRCRVGVSINRPGQNDYLPVMTVVASPGDPFFVAGQSHAGGTLVISVRVGTRTVRATIPAAVSRPSASAPSGRTVPAP